MYVAGEAELCALLMVAQKVTPIICRVQAYEVVFTAKDTKDSPLETLQSVSINVYSTCYRLLAHTSRELASKLRRARHALLEPGKAMDMISELKDLEFEHDRAVNLCHKSFTSQSSQRVEEALGKMKDFLDFTESSLKKVEAGVDRLVASDIRKTLEWISDVPYTDDHNSVKERKAQNTGAWLLRYLRDWESADSSARFWLLDTGICISVSGFLD